MVGAIRAMANVKYEMENGKWKMGLWNFIAL
jgi:hypothetical protein